MRKVAVFCRLDFEHPFAPASLQILPSTNSFSVRLHKMISDLSSEARVSATQVLLAASGLAVAYIVVTAFILPFLSHQGKYWSKQSWVGLRKQWFARYRAGANAINNTRNMVIEGYEKVSYCECGERSQSLTFHGSSQGTIRHSFFPSSAADRF